MDLANYCGRTQLQSPCGKNRLYGSYKLASHIVEKLLFIIAWYSYRLSFHIMAVLLYVCAGTNPEDIVEKYEGFTLQLTQILPMKDAIFLASLTSVGLFGKGNLKSEVKAKATASEAAQHFLDEAISKNMIISKVDLNPLYKLLNAMEKFGGVTGSLAKDMKKAIPYSGK